MKFVIVFAAVLAVAIAAPAALEQQNVETLRYDSDVQPEGYKFVYETSDGQFHQEEGQLKDVGTDHEAMVVHGSYSYVGPDGVTYQVTFTADENGFQPEGEHLPRAQ